MKPFFHIGCTLLAIALVAVTPCLELDQTSMSATTGQSPATGRLPIPVTGLPESTLRLEWQVNESRAADLPPQSRPSSRFGSAPQRFQAPISQYTFNAPYRLVNLTLDGLDLTQAVQTVSNTVPLVAGRPTMARIFARTDVTTTVIADARIEAWRNGAPLPGSPIRISPGAVSRSPSHQHLATSLNARLPAEWLQGEVVFTATVDPDNLVPELDETDNQITVSVEFQPISPLKIVLVPVQYTHEPTGQLYSPSGADPITDWIMRVYPLSDIDADLHAPLAFTGNLQRSSDWLAVLNAVSDLKASEGLHDSTVYFGLIATENALGGWFNGGIAGLGWVGFRASVGLLLPASWGADRTGQVAAHEIGHNFGQSHAPCGNPGSIDTAFPYPNGSIGQYGLDVVALKTYSPEESNDLMSYCHPQWISDYTYQALFRDQRDHGAFTYELPSPKLSVRVHFDASGTATIQPVYRMTTNHTPPTDSPEYELELAGPEGDVILRHPIAIRQAVADDATINAGFALIPAPDSIEPGSSLRLKRLGIVIAQQVFLTPAEQPEALTPEVKRNGEWIELAWGHVGQPALARYSSDGGLTWATAGIDIATGELRLLASSVSANPEGELQFEVRLGN